MGEEKKAEVEEVEVKVEEDSLDERPATEDLVLWVEAGDRSGRSERSEMWLTASFFRRREKRKWIEDKGFVRELRGDESSEGYLIRGGTHQMEISSKGDSSEGGLIRGGLIRGGHIRGGLIQGGPHPRGTHPRGTHLRGTYPRGTHPRRISSEGDSSDRDSSDGRLIGWGTHPRGTHPRGTHPRGTHPRGTHAMGDSSDVKETKIDLKRT